MNFEKELTRKILDPIHGIIRLTNLEMEFINHPLFQRLRNIKQNSFLYKVFPSAVHSRFEHSLGVLHLSYEIITNLRLNAIRYEKKYNDGHVFCDIENIPTKHIQELRLAALLHDLGHGPMSHQFESFMPTKKEIMTFFDGKYSEIFDLIKDENKKIDHEHISLVFSLIIYNDITKETDIIDKIDITNILKIIEKDYSDGMINCTVSGKTIDILPLLTSIISSCPIDADRMDYLLRDSYFSGVKCGLYDYNRLFMSIVPVVSEGKLCLAYKESGIDSIVEFIGARSSLFSQVYFHKTNRSISSMLNTVCTNMEHEIHSNLIIGDLSGDKNNDKNNTQKIIDFYLDCSDDYFINDKLGQWIESTNTLLVNENILNAIVERKPWSKIYESKYLLKNISITQGEDKKLKETIAYDMNNLLSQKIPNNNFTIDIVVDVAFKDIQKSKVKLLVKELNNKYTIKDLEQCGDKLNQYQSIQYIIRVFVDRKAEGFDYLKAKLPSEIDEKVKKHF